MLATCTAQRLASCPTSVHPVQFPQAHAKQRKGGVIRLERQATAAQDTRLASRLTCHAVNVVEGGLSAPGRRFGIVVARFNDLVTKLLLDGALAGFRRAGVADSDIEVCWVPGSFELPLVAKSMAKSNSFDAVVCIGVVVRGATTHYEAVCNAAVSGCLNASLDTGVPVVFGVLTCDTMEQAQDRAGGKVGNKGYEAAVTAIEMCSIMGQLREKGHAVQPWV